MRLPAELKICFFHDDVRYDEGLPLVVTGFMPSQRAVSGVQLVCEFLTKGNVLSVDMALVLGRDPQVLREIANSINRRDEAETERILRRVLLCQKYGL